MGVGAFFLTSLSRPSTVSCCEEAAVDSDRGRFLLVETDVSACDSGSELITASKGVREVAIVVEYQARGESEIIENRLSKTRERKGERIEKSENASDIS